ncbi:MAG: DUF2500 domain-containing protein [Candidatus Faecalibacterium intestinavium]|uniref:DUF2500 domain-containing protein n=1 Tax=Candidatus Faecalibacterium intestinavium TaxID=2838580 RepID=A0A9E2NPK4_9FIRM|nr:DUF2500 domain-containing protein [Candidatus Faecalibacterium intestinavium]
MGFFFGWFDVLFTLMFLLVFGLILLNVFRGLVTWNKNNNSPRLKVRARVAGKRQNVSHHHNAAGGMGAASTRYYATFEVESGDRMELQLSGTEYGLLAEGDQGELSFQGTRYLGFERA